MNDYPNFLSLLSQRPQAMARISGSAIFPEIQGNVWFYQTSFGVLVVADIEGLPKDDLVCSSPIFAFHIHNGDSCTGNSEDQFANAGTHYNPNNCPHPYHAGDLPPLFSANGYAFSAVLTNRFKVNEIIGKTIIIHSNVDDFVSQPSGNSGSKIACGEIKRT
ncbi:MAG: superoxide dismutase family protein [Clostridia bacterium]|nr:superoxide dismutase family protein [Clostridia bacterium]